VLVRDLQNAAAAVNDVAAEHLLLLLDEPEDFLPSVRNAGAIFLGSWSAVPFGDYGLASNHVLPTAGTARFSSGLRAADYVTITSVMRMSPAAAAHFSLARGSATRRPTCHRSSRPRPASTRTRARIPCRADSSTSSSRRS